MSQSIHHDDTSKQHIFQRPCSLSYPGRQRRNFIERMYKAAAYTLLVTGITYHLFMERASTFRGHAPEPLAVELN